MTDEFETFCEKCCQERPVKLHKGKCLCDECIEWVDGLDKITGDKS
jgi:hypothetical protein